MGTPPAPRIGTSRRCGRSTSRSSRHCLGAATPVLPPCAAPRAPQAAHQRVDVYSGVARLAKTVWASEVRAPGTRPTTAVMICHPSANFLGHYALPGSFCALRSPAEAPGRSLREASSMASLRCRTRRSAIRHDVQSLEGALPHDVLTLAHSARATAPDGRSFADIRQTEGVAGIKRAQEAQYSSGWLRARMARFQIALLQTTASG